MRWAKHVARVKHRSGVCRVSVGKPEKKRLTDTPRRRWEDNVNGFQEVV
jgi:hypothetical protein